MRVFYSITWWFALPIVLLRLWVRGRQEPGYRLHIPERIGFYPTVGLQKRLWVHAVSAGETRAAEPLIRALLVRYPQHQILLTHMTPIGRETGRILFADQPRRMIQSFIPYDVPFFIQRFLKHFAPQICILIETEVWPNLVAECHDAHIPVVLVNARLSEKSLNKAFKMPGLILPAAQAVSAVAAQSGPDAVRLKKLGVERIRVTGNMKFDVAPPVEMAHRGARLREAIGTRPMFICASTRDGEEALIINAYMKLRLPRGLLVITPRHPQRFDEVADLLTAQNIHFVRRSSLNLDDPTIKLDPQVQVLLGDSMGEMYMYYAACDVAFIGGSLVPLGGHNLIEACAMGKPVLTGPHTFNFSEITNQAIIAEAAIRAANAEQIMVLAQNLLVKPSFRLNMGRNALAFFQQHQGATARTMALLEHHIKDSVK